jgi:hypothetical protein
VLITTSPRYRVTLVDPGFRTVSKSDTTWFCSAAERSANASCGSR